MILYTYILILYLYSDIIYYCYCNYIYSQPAITSYNSLLLVINS